MKEIWKDIEGFDGYQVSNFGRIKSFKQGKNGYLMSQNYRGCYLSVTLSLNMKAKPCSIHRLVALHFIPNPENKPQVNHKDGNKLNNHVDNLEWVTASENAKHAYNNNLIKKLKGEEHHMYGKRHSKESLDKMSAATKGENNGMYKYKWTNEQKYKMSESIKLWWKLKKQSKK